MPPAGETRDRAHCRPRRHAPPTGRGRPRVPDRDGRRRGGSDGDSGRRCGGSSESSPPSSPTRRGRGVSPASMRTPSTWSSSRSPPEASDRFAPQSRSARRRRSPCRSSARRRWQRTGRLTEALELSDRAGELTELVPLGATYNAVVRFFALMHLDRPAEADDCCRLLEALLDERDEGTSRIWLLHLNGIRHLASADPRRHPRCI